MKCIIVKNITSCIRTVCGIKLDKNQSCNLGEYSDSKLQLIRALQAAGLQVSLEDFNKTPYNYPAYSKETKVVAKEFEETKAVVEKSEKAEKPKETKVVVQEQTKVKEVKQSAKVETKTKTTGETKQAKSNAEKTKVNKEV